MFIADYIDHVYSNSPFLYPRDAVARAEVRILMARYTNKVYRKLVYISNAKQNGFKE